MGLHFHLSSSLAPFAEANIAAMANRMPSTSLGRIYLDALAGLPSPLTAECTGTLSPPPGSTSGPRHSSSIAVRDPFTADRPALGLMTRKDTSLFPVTKKRPNTHGPQKMSPPFMSASFPRAL